MKKKVDALHAEARASRGKLEASRMRAAAAVREQLDAERQRGDRQSEEAEKDNRGRRDEIYTWHKLGMMEP